MAVLDGARKKVKTGLANMSFFLALGGGILGSVSMLGGWLTAATEIGPWWTPLACFAISIVVCLGDWAEGDATPNRRAVYTAIIFPSFFVASLTGECGAKLFESIGAINAKTGKEWKSGVKNWVDLPGNLENAFTVFSVICIVAAITYAQMYAKKSKAAATTGTTASTAPNRRR